MFKNLSSNWETISNKILLVSDGKDVSTSDLIRKIAKSIGKPARLFNFPPILLKILGKLTGQNKVINRLCENLQIDGISYLGSDPKIYKNKD